MNRLAASLLVALTVFAADDPWTKVKEIDSGSELRIFKKGMTKPILAKMDEATDDSLRVVVKNEQVSIRRNDIDQIDARAKGGPRVVRETKTKVDDPNTKAAPPASPHAAQVPGMSSSSNVTFGAKADFETIYRRGRPIQ